MVGGRYLSANTHIREALPVLQLVLRFADGLWFRV